MNALQVMFLLFKNIYQQNNFMRQEIKKSFAKLSLFNTFV